MAIAVATSHFAAAAAVAHDDEDFAVEQADFSLGSLRPLLIADTTNFVARFVEIADVEELMEDSRNKRVETHEGLTLPDAECLTQGESLQVE